MYRNILYLKLLTHTYYSTKNLRSFRSKAFFGGLNNVLPSDSLLLSSRLLNGGLILSSRRLNGGLILSSRHLNGGLLLSSRHLNGGILLNDEILSGGLLLNDGLLSIDGPLSGGDLFRRNTRLK